MGDYEYHSKQLKALGKQIKQAKKRLIAKHGPEFAKRWAPRVRNVQ